MSDPKQPAPDPEIPDELKAKLSKPKRPAGFQPKSENAEDDNAPPEIAEVKPVRDLQQTIAALALGFDERKFYKTIIEEKDVKRRIEGSKAFEWVREKREVKVQVELFLGADGLPYCNEPISSSDTKRVREKSYKEAPPMDPNLGDLTPAFSEWLLLNQTYDWVVRYAARSSHIQAWAIAHAN